MFMVAADHQKNWLYFFYFLLIHPLLFPLPIPWYRRWRIAEAKGVKSCGKLRNKSIKTRTLLAGG